MVRGQGIEAARASVGDLNATLGGDFRVAKTAGKPTVLLGAVNTVRGTYSYQGRRFDLVRDGQILFRGNEEIDPRLDISAERVIQGVEARVRIQGTARKPELSLSSTPPLDEGDILALIVFNQPLNQLGTGQQNSLAQRAGGIAAGFVVSPLAEALGSTLDLDQFEVETTDPTGRVNPAVVIGQQVTQDMFLRFRQQFGNQQVIAVPPRVPPGRLPATAGQRRRGRRPHGRQPVPHAAHRTLRRRPGLLLLVLTQAHGSRLTAQTALSMILSLGPWALAGLTPDS